MTYLSALLLATALVTCICLVAALLASWVMYSARADHHLVITGAPVIIFMVLIYSLAFSL